MPEAMTATMRGQDDIRRLQLARGFAHFVMEIVKANIEKGGDERALYDDLLDAALKADVQWMPAEQFRLMKAIENTLMDAAMRSAPLPFQPVDSRT